MAAKSKHFPIRELREALDGFLALAKETVITWEWPSGHSNEKHSPGDPNFDPSAETELTVWKPGDQYLPRLLGAIDEVNKRASAASAALGGLTGPFISELRALMLSCRKFFLPDYSGFERGEPGMGRLFAIAEELEAMGDGGVAVDSAQRKPKRKRLDLVNLSQRVALALSEDSKHGNKQSSQADLAKRLDVSVGSINKAMPGAKRLLQVGSGRAELSESHAQAQGLTVKRPSRGRS